MFSLSICMIVKNEEDVLGRCLNCAKEFADEIIIVDTGSTDKTKDIAALYTDKIYNFPWINDFSAARNFSFSKATQEYVMWLDADDVVDYKNSQAIKTLKSSLDPAVDMIMFKYDVAFDENENTTFSYYRERIFKRSMEYRWISEIHEVIPISGNVVYSPIAIFHKKINPNEPERNLKIFEQMVADGKKLDARQKYYYARELYYNARYQEAIERLLLFINDGQGWVENNISACSDLANCYNKLGQESLALESLFKSFRYGPPRAEVCCEIGKYFLEKNDYYTAIFWYKLASERPIQEENGAFVLRDCYGFTPFLQLCVCYDRLGDYRTANKYNQKAGKLKPNNAGYLYNKQYFVKLLKNIK